MSGREGRRRLVARSDSSFRTIVALTLIPIFALLAYLLWQFIAGAPGGERPVRESRQVPKKTTGERPGPPLSSFRGKIVIILDDVGFDRQPLERAMAIDPNVSFSILPNAPRAVEAAELLHRRGFEILCHLPMEPADGRYSPGPNAITTAMADDEIGRLTRENVAAVRYARGVNNHMGSRATVDRRVMRSVLTSLPEGMYFIDSMTTSESVGSRVAHELRIPTAVRTVFLDSIQDETAIRRQVAILAADARENGVAVAIGHMYPVTIDVLRREMPRLRRSGIRVVRASAVVE